MDKIYVHLRGKWGQPLTQDKTEIILKSYFIYALIENHI